MPPLLAGKLATLSSYTTLCTLHCSYLLFHAVATAVLVKKPKATRAAKTILAEEEEEGEGEDSM